MTSQLRSELRAMVDDTVGVDLIDGALRDARNLRRRRHAAVGAAAAVAMVAVVPIALGVGGPTGFPSSPVPTSSIDHSGCGTGGVNSPNLVTEAADPLSGVRMIIKRHLPAGYAFDTTDAYSVCGSNPTFIADYRISKLAPPGSAGPAGVTLLSVTRVTSTDLVSGLSYPLGGPIVSTRCADLLQPMPSAPAPEPSISDAPTANPLVSAGPPQVRSCTDGGDTGPMVYVVAQGPSLTAGAVYPDHHAVVAQAIDQPMLTAQELLAIVTDSRLSIPVTVD